MYQDFDILFGDPVPRRDRWDHSQIDWDAHVEQLCHKQHFNRENQMSLQAFNKLISLLSPLLKRNDAYSHASGPISPVIIVGIGIRYLAGGELSDIRHVFGVSIAEVYNCIKCFLDTILCCESVKIMLPRNPEEWDEVAARFAKVS